MLWWEMRPTRERARAPPGHGTPASRALPEDGLSRPASRRSNVVLPAPFGPNTARQSPGASENETPATAFLDPKARAMSTTSTTGLPAAETADVEDGIIRLQLATLARATQNAVSLRLAPAQWSIDLATMTDIDVLLTETRKFEP